MKVVSNQFHAEFIDIIDQVRKHAECEFVQRYVDVPSMPYMRMQILFLFLYESGVPLERIKNHLIPTVLIQLALDCHEEVTLVPQTTETGVRTRQLSVLAGDYYSSKYYYILSKLEDIWLIRSLARSIGEINEGKTLLYSGNNWNGEETLQLLNQIDSALYLGFVPQFSAEPSFWKQLIQGFALLERLGNELLAYRMGQAVVGYLKKLSERTGIEQACLQVQSRIEQALNQIEKLKEEVRSHLVKDELQSMLNVYQQQISNRIQI